MASFETDTVQVDDSRQGAAALARSADHQARKIVVRLMKRHHPKKSKHELYRMFSTETEDEAEFQEAFRYYYFTNMYQAELRLLDRPKPITGPKPNARAAAAAAAAKLAEKLKDDILHVLTLEFVMPNGLRLRDCTGAQCTEAGGQFAAIGNKVGPTRKVGEVIRDDRALAAVLKKP